MNHRPRNPNANHRRTSSDPLGADGACADADLDSPVLSSLLEFDVTDLLPLGRPNSFDEETEKQLLDCGEYTVSSPRSRPDSGNFAGIQFDGMLLPNSPHGSPMMTRPHNSYTANESVTSGGSVPNNGEPMQIDAVAEHHPLPRQQQSQHPHQYAAKAAQKKGHRRTASEPFFNNITNGLDGAVYAQGPPGQQTSSPHHMSAPTPPPPPIATPFGVRMQQPLSASVGAPPRRLDDPRASRPPLQTIPSQRDLPFGDSPALTFSSTVSQFGDGQPLFHAPTPALDAVALGQAEPPKLSLTSAFNRGPFHRDPRNGSKRETKIYKCSKCGEIKANHNCKAVAYDSVAKEVQTDPTRLVKTLGQRTICVSKKGN